MTLPDWIERAIATQLEREHAAIEAALEDALQGGTYGVLLIRSEDSIRVGPHPAVPYGHLYEVPEVGYAAFLSRWAEGER